MGQASSRLNRRRMAKKVIADLVEQPEVIAIHYSCEDISERPNGTSARITSIAVKNLDTKQTTSFSIHQIAEKKGYNLNTLEQDYDTLEKQMLKEFYKFVAEHRNFKWLHWNMCNSVYGFAAIAHRYQVLGGKPIELQDSKLYALADLLIDIHGPNYASHPRLESIVRLNKITNQNFMNGKDEVEAFANKRYVKLHQSVIRKVDILHTLLQQQADGRLQTAASWWDQYGNYAQILITWTIRIIILIGAVNDIAGLVSLYQKLW